ncbi:hypothetical protein QQF64_036410 [Cirrhinus molitorella]|uniref:FISNA domain-containing protein n=1 Tax=Cirrhinus molitorella TaxID=172907 RepID=A0ABR3NIV2_9TELE
MEEPITFKSGDTRPGLSSVQQKTLETEFSCVTVKSDESMVCQEQFKSGDTWPGLSNEVLNTFRSNLMKKFERLYEGTVMQGNPTLLNEIYTELYITESESGEISNEHELCDTLGAGENANYRWNKLSDWLIPGNLKKRLEDTVWAEFDEVERIIRQMSNILEIQPCIAIQRDKVQKHIFLGFSRREIAERFGVSLKTLQRRIARWGIRRDDLNNCISGEELDVIVTEIHHRFPSTGYKLILGHLRSRQIFVKKSRVLASLRRVDPQGLLMRRLSLRTLKRRCYSVPAPNSIWHIAGNHELIRWRVVVHGGIDGFSRLILYQTVLESFLSAVEQYGVPSRVCSDKGGENTLVAHYMVDQQCRGADTGVYSPELVQPCALSAVELETLPNPTVPLPETIPVYIETVRILREMLDV